MAGETNGRQYRCRHFHSWWLGQTDRPCSWYGVGSHLAVPEAWRGRRLGEIVRDRLVEAKSVGEVVLS